MPNTHTMHAAAHTQIVASSSAFPVLISITEPHQPILHSKYLLIPHNLIHIMASSSSTSFVVLLFLISLALVFSHGESFDPSASDPSMVDCDTHLLPLAPCAPFVQGFDSSPLQVCCDSIDDLYRQQPNCLCLLLNDTAMSAFPINRTLAMELPPLCNLQLDYSICPGFVEPSNPTSPESQVSPGTSSNSSTAAPPGSAMPPKSNMGLLFTRSTSEKLKIKGSSMLLVVMVLLLI